MKYSIVIVCIILCNLPLSLQAQSLYLEKTNGVAVVGSFNRITEGDGFSIQSGIGNRGNFDFGISYAYQEFFLKEQLIYRASDSTYAQKIRATYNTTNFGFYFRFIPLKQHSFTDFFTLSLEGALHNLSRGFISEGSQYFQGGVTISSKINYSYESRIIPHISWVNRYGLKDNKNQLHFLTYGFSFTYKKVNRSIVLIDFTKTKEHDYSLISFSIGYIFDFGYGR